MLKSMSNESRVNQKFRQGLSDHDNAIAECASDQNSFCDLGLESFMSSS